MRSVSGLLGMREEPLLRPEVLGWMVAGLVLAISVANLALPDTYVRETPDWRMQAVVQDWVDAVLLVPWLALCGWGIRRGWAPALPLLAGGLAFAAYSFAIFAFAVHFNRMFVAYCVTLGLSAFALVRVCMALPRRAPLPGGQPARVAGAFLALIGLAFLALWMLGDVGAIAAGEVPEEVRESGLPVNPVHVLDYAATLPLLVAAGVSCLRRKPFGLLAAPVLYAFAVLTDIAILGIQLAAREPGDSRAPMLAVGAVTLVSVVMLAWLVASMRPAQDPTSP